jgi:hypothetical protein
MPRNCDKSFESLTRFEETHIMSFLSIRTKLIALIASAVVGSLPSVAFSQTYTDIVLSGNPLLYWNFNEAGDTDPALDLVGAEAGDNLLPEGGATRVTSGSTAGSLSLGRAASFDGTQFTKFFSGALSPATNPDAWAVEMWVRPTGADPGDRFDYLLESRGGGNNRPGLLFDYGFNNKVEVFGGGGRTEGAGPSLANDVWHHVVMGNFGDANDRIDFYLNGAAAGSVAYTFSLPFGTDQIAVGNSVPGNANFDHFAGQIDELALYDLTGQSVSAINGKLSSLATHYAASSQPTIPGDANKDGVVNGLDFDLISTNLFTSQTPGFGGDLDLNAIVNFADFRLWKAVAPAEIVAQYVPEPTSLVLAAVVVFAAVSRARKA